MIYIFLSQVSKLDVAVRLRRNASWYERLGGVRGVFDTPDVILTGCMALQIKVQSRVNLSNYYVAIQIPPCTNCRYPL